MRDSRRSAVYAAESLVFNIFDRAGPGHTVQLVGTSLTLPVEARFGSAAAVGEHVAAVLALPGVRNRFERAAVPVRVRPRRGFTAATYRRDLAEIAVPESAAGRWALRELVVLHEIAHHLDDSGGPAHGPGFVDTLIELAGLVMGPETALVYRVMFTDSGVR